MGLAWHLVGLPVFSAGIAALELDGVLIGQWLLSRPLVVGPLTGWLLGDLAAGAALGALIELFCLEELPVGSIVPPNGAVAAACAVLLAAGPALVSPAAALPAGLALGAAHGWLESRVRSWRAVLTAEAAAELAGTGAVSWGPLWRRSVGMHWVVTAGFVYLSTALAGVGLGSLWAALPDAVRAGFERVWGLAPLLALGSLAQRLWR
ncbi:MAG: PTS sugar transporter subunit IIC [Elusimicrobia bacterium]|nr:PTS sugar transporter subunit IIC [Elusimicrobiota bacterium]